MSNVFIDKIDRFAHPLHSGYIVRMFTSAYRQLTPVEKAFVDGYVRDLEREAARTHDRLSNALYRPVPDDVREASRGLLDRPMVTAAITERVSDLAREAEITRERVVKEVAGIALSNIMDYGETEHDGTFRLDLTHATPEQMARVEMIEVEEVYSPTGGARKKMKIKLYNKPAMLIELMKYMGADPEHYKASQARPVVPQLPESVTVDQAGDLYARAIGG